MIRLAIFAIIALLHIIGCVMNLIALVTVAIHSAPMTTLVVFRVIGLFFPPLGALLGWFA